MAVAILSKALEEFTLALDDIGSSAEFVRAATRLRPRLNAMLDWNNMDAQARAFANAFLSQKGAQESILYRGLVIAVSGAYEEYVRRIVRDCVLALNKPGLEYDKLHDGLKKKNVFWTGMAMRTVFEPPDHLILDYELLSKNIGTCFGGSKQPVLNAEAFAVFLSVISPEQLVEALERIGVKLKWDVLGQIQELRDALNKKDTRETAKALKEFLKTFGQKRNKIAHTGSSGVVVTETEIDDILILFRIFATGLASAVEKELSHLV